MNKRAQAIDLPPKFAHKLDLSRPAAEQITLSLKTAILEMSLVPGQKISEAEVGNFFGASRTPVREAFTWLRDQGLIVTYPSRGNFVTKLSVPQIKAAQFIRESLEVSSAEFLCTFGLSAEAIDEIEENLSSQESFIESVQGTAFHSLDDQFHLALVDTVDHPRIWRIIQREKTSLDRLRVLSLSSSDYLAILVEDHRRIFEAIRSGDHTEARQSVQLHLRRVLDTLTDLVEAHGDYFDE